MHTPLSSNSTPSAFPPPPPGMAGKPACSASEAQPIVRTDPAASPRKPRRSSEEGWEWFGDRRELMRRNIAGRNLPQSDQINNRYYRNVIILLSRTIGMGVRLAYDALTMRLLLAVMLAASAGCGDD